MRTLVLNLDYTPLSVVSGHRGIWLAKKDYVNVLEEYDKIVKTEREDFFVPAVLWYMKYVDISPKTTPSKRYILMRDGYVCQYCECTLSKKGATIDHVKPVSHFAKRPFANTWDNMVACCRDCNSVKADRTPEQAGMKLKSKPGKPRYFINSTYAPKEWRKYL